MTSRGSNEKKESPSSCPMASSRMLDQYILSKCMALKKRFLGQIGCKLVRFGHGTGKIINSVKLLIP
jgi:hypothetical protein